MGWGSVCFQQYHPLPNPPLKGEGSQNRKFRVHPSRSPHGEVRSEAKPRTARALATASPARSIVTPAKAGAHPEMVAWNGTSRWIPAFAGMTAGVCWWHPIPT